MWHLLFIRHEKNGGLWIWGNNQYGQIGNGTTINAWSPVQIGDTTWISASAGEESVVATNDIGNLMAWGRNTYGQLGDGTYINRDHPTQIATGNWIDVSGGFGHSIAKKSDKSLWSTGWNLFGQLGLGNTTDINAHQKFHVV